MVLIWLDLAAAYYLSQLDMLAVVKHHARLVGDGLHDEELVDALIVGPKQLDYQVVSMALSGAHYVNPLSNEHIPAAG